METQSSGMGVPADDLPAIEYNGDDFDPEVKPPTVVVNDPKTYDPPR